MCDYEVPPVGTVNTVAFWDATQCSLVGTFIFLEFQIFSHKINSKKFLCRLRNSKTKIFKCRIPII